MAQRQREIIEMDQLLNDGFSSDVKSSVMPRWQRKKLEKERREKERSWIMLWWLTSKFASALKRVKTDPNYFVQQVFVTRKKTHPAWERLRKLALISD